MEQQIKQTMKERIKNKAISVGMNATLRAAKKDELEFIVYASNLSEEMLKELSDLRIDLYKYDGDSEALSIACSKSFNISVLGVKK